MLQLKHIFKSYHVGDTVTHALHDVTISFRDQEFVAILGPSGSGKTTMLNVIGGLDRYDKGDLIINGKSTKNFKETDWDAYRNNTVGFIFQNYNLIPHLSIIANVELGMNLSGVPSKERHDKAIKALTEVGLKEHINKRPNQLSGGQMQRVAIARAIANDPDILLCDEPTGALDTETSVQIMELIKKISNGFQKQINTTMSKALAKYPISISQTATDMNSMNERNESNKNVKNRGYVTAKKDQSEQAQHTNKITQKYVNYVKKINPSYANNISYQRGVTLNLLSKVKGEPERVQFSNSDPDQGSSVVQARAQAMSSMGIGSSVFPTTLNKNKGSFLKQNYQILSGTWPTKATDLILVTDNKNTVNLNSLKNLGFDVSENDQIKFNKLVGKTFKVVANNDYYQELPNGMFIPKKVTSSMYNNAKTKLILVGVIRPKNEDSMALLSTGIAYSDKLSQEVINDNKNSDVVKAQKKTNHSVLTNQKLNANEKKMTMQTLGGSSIPTGIMIYPNNFDDKDKVLDYLDKWNKGKKKADKIVYTDMSNAVTTMTGGLLNGITTILVAFAAISLITSMIMIGILTYTSVLERTKEIGVLKALGARKKDITRVFDAETFILGVFSGVLGIFIAYLLTFPINTVIYNITDLANVAQLDPKAAIILIIVSTVLTLLGGHIPARMAAKKDAAIALRSE